MTGYGLPCRFRLKRDQRMRVPYVAANLFAEPWLQEKTTIVELPT